MSKLGERSLRKQISLQDGLIRTLEEQVVALNDTLKIKDLTLQALVGAIGASVEPGAIRAITDKPHGPGQYL